MILPTIALAMMFAPTEDLTTGTRLYHSCQSASRFAGDTSLGPTAEDISRVSECIAYISGVVDAMHLDNAPLFCTGNATVGTTVKVYVAYMDKNPKLLDERRIIGLAGALMDSYPCPVKK